MLVRARSPPRGFAVCLGVALTAAQPLCRRDLVLILRFGRDSAQDELLRQVGGGSLPGSEKEISKHQPRATIRWGIGGIRDGSRGQIPTDGRVVRLRLSV